MTHPKDELVAVTEQNGLRLFVAALTCMAALAVASSAVGQTRGVVELFTSQGCSSCPAADKLMGELARDSSLVVMSVPIDYWDYLGWRDTLAKPRHSARQRGYAKRRGDREVYTPQAVVNGATHVHGSDRAAIERAVASTKSVADILSLPVTFVSADGQLQVKIGEARPVEGEVWACGLSRTVAVTIDRGENGGRTVTYHNVVRRWIKLGDWSGVSRSFTLPRRELAAEGADAVAVIVQAGTMEQPGTLLGAASTSLR